MIFMKISENCERKIFPFSAVYTDLQGMDLNDLTYKVRGAIFKVHASLGPGLLESVYVAALVYELIRVNLNIQTQVGVPVNYKDVKLELGVSVRHTCRR